MTIPNVDNTTLNNLVPNLDVGDVADPELRLLAFQYIYAELQVIVNELNNIPAGNIQNLSITAAKLANLAVETGKIADLAVTTGKIADLAVTLAKLANNSVGTNQIVNAAVTAAKIMDGVLTSAKFVPGALTNDTQNALRITALEEEFAALETELIETEYGKTNAIEKLTNIRNLLDLGLSSVCFTVQGDSTGNDENEWFYLTMLEIADKYPEYTCIIRRWNGTTQSYSDFYSLIQTGSDGEAYAALPGVNGSNITTPDSAKLSITGDLDIAIKVALDDWAASGDHALINKLGNDPDRAWCFSIGADKKPYLWWSADGSTLIGPIKSTAAITTANGDAVWLRCTLDVDNGAGGYDLKFYTSGGGVSWTQLGDTITGGSTTSIHDNSVNIALGSRASDVWAGKLYEARIRASIDGQVVASPNLSMAFPSGVTTFNDVEGNVWTVNGTVTIANGAPCMLWLNGSMPGAQLSYSADTTRFALQTTDLSLINFISYGHNEGAKTAYTAEYEAFIAQLLVRCPNSLIVCVAQNPELSSYQYYAQHGLRNEQICDVATSGRYGLVDAYHEFINTGLQTKLVNVDGIHPVAIGSTLWSKIALRFLAPISKN